MARAVRVVTSQGRYSFDADKFRVDTSDRLTIETGGEPVAFFRAGAWDHVSYVDTETGETQEAPSNGTRVARR